MFKFKTLPAIIYAVMLLASSAFAVENKPCKILTSPPDYLTMNVVVNDVGSAFYPNSKVGSGFVSFPTAYTDFYNSVKETIQGYCNKYDSKGAVNMSIKFDVTDNGYYFTAQYDVFK